MSHLQVAVLRGGPSEEYQISMRTGSTVLQALAENGYQVKDVIITRQGEWLDRGLVRNPESVLQAVDVVFVALHGSYGEDGEVQKILQRLSIPFTGSRSFASALAFNKSLTKQSLLSHGVLMPEHREVSRDDEEEVVTIANSITDTFGPEYIIKPVASGSSFGVELVRAGQSLAEALNQSLARYERVLVEEFIRGKEATCATLENFRSESMYVFPTVEIIPPRDTQFFTTDSKYSGETIEICPSRFSYSERSRIAEVSALVHDVLDLSQYSRSDFIVSDKGIYFLEVNTLPGLTAESLYPKAAAAVGLDIRQLVAHLVETATC
jgi:D-alanine-D-alanine ligase